MMSRGRGVNPVPGLFLALWTWCCVWYCLLSPSVAKSTDHRPRAVLLSFARENDLPAMLSSVSQLEETFNDRYRYDWVFFSTSSLSEDFRRLTSNATKAACAYEVIHDELWSVPKKGASDSTPQPSEWEMESEEESSAFARQMRGWKSGRFAKESRLKSYDWFWTVEPGAQFIHDIDFDVFRVMRDHGIAYGSHDGGINEVYMRRLSQHIRSFIDVNPDVMLEEADVSWLFEAAAAVAKMAHGRGGTTDDSLVARDDGMMLDGTDGWLDDGKDEKDVGSPVEVLASRLGSIYRNSLWPTFEVGSLAFLRSQSHQALLEHLDQSDALVDRGGKRPRLSGSLLLPQKNVLHFRNRKKEDSKEPQSTSKPKFSLVRVVGDGLARNDSLQRRVKALTAERWELMVHDICRQGVMPGLRSGNTAVDERTFKLGPKYGVVVM